MRIVDLRIASPALVTAPSAVPRDYTPVHRDATWSLWAVLFREDGQVERSVAIAVGRDELDARDRFREVRSEEPIEIRRVLLEEMGFLVIQNVEARSDDG